MANFISFRGMFFPGIEEVNLTYKGKTPIPREKVSKYILFNGDTLTEGMPFIYKGPDREAMYMLKENGVDYLGQDFTHDPSFLEMVRKLNYNSTEDYLKAIGYDENKDKQRFEKLAKKVSYHELPDREDEAFILGGGKDTSGSAKSYVGGFGEPVEKVAEPRATKAQKREEIPV